MKQKIQKQGIVINKQIFNESSEIISVLTKDGIDKVIVKGSKKQDTKTRAYTIKYNYISYEKTDSSLGTLVQCDIIDSNTMIQSDINKGMYLEIITEKIIKLSDFTIDHEKCFDVFLSFFDHIKNYDYEKIIVAIFELKFTYLLGVKLSFNICPICKNRHEHGYFDFQLGSSICQSCKNNDNNKKYIDQNFTSILKQLYQIKISDISEEYLGNISTYIDYKLLNKFIDEYYDEFLGFKNKTKKIIFQIIDKKM